MNEKWKSAFDQIHAEEALKDHTKEYLSEKIYSHRSASRPVLRRAAVLVAGLVLLFFIGGSWIFMTPTAYIIDTVETCADGRENIQCHSGDTEEIHEAHNAGVSFGKYRAYLILRDRECRP